MNKLYFLGFYLYLLATVNAKFCEVNADCSIEAVCTKGLCTCNVGQILSNDGERCLEISSGIGTECLEDIQCLPSIIGPSVCTKDFLCGCKPGYRYVNNECVTKQGYKGSCSTFVDCYDGINLNALVCEGDECVCNEDYYLRGDSDCRLSGNTTKKCFFDIDCQSDTECCEFKYGPTGDCVSKLDSNNTCSGIEKLNQKKYEFLENITYSMKSSRLSKIDIICSTNNDCSAIKNSFCFELKNKCSCKNGFLYDKYKNICVKGLGSSCVTDEDCPIVNSYCNKNKICTCKDYFVNSNYNDKCFKPARGINMSCVRDENCYSLGIYGTCNKNKCDCKLDSEYDETLIMCRPISNPEISGCKDNCEKKPHSTCVNNKCQCNENYTSSNNKCLPDLGYQCSEVQKDCVIENAECANNKCECMKGYLQTDKRTCLKEINENDDVCTTNLQCEKYLGTGGICLNGNCTCTPEYDKMIVKESEACVLKRRIGGQCNLNIHCKTILQNKHVVCRNSKCLCDYNYILIEDEKGQRCESGASVLLISNLLVWIIAGILIASN